MHIHVYIYAYIYSAVRPMYTFMYICNVYMKTC